MCGINRHCAHWRAVPVLGVYNVSAKPLQPLYCSQLMWTASHNYYILWWLYRSVEHVPFVAGLPPSERVRCCHIDCSVTIVYDADQAGVGYIELYVWVWWKWLTLFAAAKHVCFFVIADKGMDCIRYFPSTIFWSIQRNISLILHYSDWLTSS